MVKIPLTVDWSIFRLYPGINV